MGGSWVSASFKNPTVRSKRLRGLLMHIMVNANILTTTNCSVHVSHLNICRGSSAAA